MKNATKILIVDDHPIVLRGYQICLQQIQEDLNLKIDLASDCSSVLLAMEHFPNDFYNLILMDISLPASDCKKASSGEDLGFYIRRKFPDTKIIVHTGLNDMQYISNIFNTIKPEGFLIKSDIDEDTLISSVCSVLNNQTYYSEKVKYLLSPDDFNDIYLDNWNRKILFHLSLGYKMKELPEHIPLSLPTIERRKKELKSLLGIPLAGTRELLEVARNKGFI